jgi:2-methylisocitrate lyase-like PEP mutase family enzyme
VIEVSPAAAASTSAARLRSLLARDQLLTVPGCSDALGARLIEQAGFDATYMTGFGSSATLLGMPDVGLLSAAEMASNAGRITAATSLPLIADADTGYGNALNVMHTVREYERRDVAAIQIEDQVAPKRCGHMADKSVVSQAEMIAKICAAVDARDEMLVIARTDARAPEGLDAAIERAHAYADAGADVLFVEALESPDEFARVGGEAFGAPLVYNWVEGGRSPALDPTEIFALGYRILLLPISLLLAATRAMQETLTSIRESGTTAPGAFGDQPFDRFTEMIGLPEFLADQARYGADA